MQFLCFPFQTCLVVNTFAIGQETVLDCFVDLMKYSRCFCDFELPCSLVVCSDHATAHRDMKSSTTHCNRPSNAALLSQTYFSSRYTTTFHDILRFEDIVRYVMCGSICQYVMFPTFFLWFFASWNPGTGEKRFWGQKPASWKVRQWWHFAFRSQLMEDNN